MLRLYCIDLEEIKKWLIFAKNGPPLNVGLHFCFCSFPIFVIWLAFEIICQTISIVIKSIFNTIYYLFILPIVYICNKFIKTEEVEAEMREIRIITEIDNNSLRSSVIQLKNCVHQNELYFINNIKGLKINSSNISTELDDKIHKIFGKDDKEKICSICLDKTNNSVENIVILFCSHYYHYKCLYNCYQHNNFLCPMCKKDFIGN